MKSGLLATLIFTILFFTQAGFTQVVDPAVGEFVKDHGQSPDAYVIEKFKKHDIILLGEHHLVRQNLLFVQQLIPTLYANGVYALGMEFGAQEDQMLLDSLINAPAYDQTTAEKIMFHYNVTWGYSEYIDIYKAAWALNHSLPLSARKFRILNLSYVYRWEGFNGKRSPESMRKVFPKGTTDKFRMEIIEKEIIDKGGKILALVGTPHAYTKYGSPYYQYNADQFCAFDRGWLGNRLYDKYGDKVFSILLHQPFTTEINGQYVFVSPAGGMLEKGMKVNKFKPVGFDLAGTPVGQLRDHSQHSLCYPDFRLEQFFDGYIFLALFNKMEGCTPIDNFVNEQNIQHALQQFPDPDWHEQVTNLEEMRTFIRKNGQRIVTECKNLHR